MNISIIPFGSILLSLCLSMTPWAASNLALAPRTIAQAASSTPGGSNRHVRTELLGKATSHLSPNWKNPGISERGLAPEIVTALQQQQAYLHSSRLPSARAASLPFGPKPTEPCRDPAIRAVNGKAAQVIFTPQTPDNSYRIEGCLFGNVRGHLDLEPHPADPKQTMAAINLTLDTGSGSWSDSEIHAHLDPHLSGIPDVPVTLVIHLSEGRRLELPGCLLVAARSNPKLLGAIPASWVTLQPSTVRSQPIDQLEYVSPPVKGSGIPADATGSSAFVARLDSQNFGTGTDVYDFAELNPGWVVDSAQLQTYSAPCPGPSPSRQSSGHWDTQWNGRRLTVNLQDDVCTSRVSPSFTFNLSLSQYALRVWVIGPVGTNPVPDALLHEKPRSSTQPN